MSFEQTIPEKMASIVDEFSWSEGREKIELLLQYSESLLPIPANFTGNQAQTEQVHECMTPVFIEAEKIDGVLNFYFDIPRESPTVRGFASILQSGLKGSSPETILQIPNDFYLALGLESVLTYQRLNGFSGILTRIKRIAAEKIAE